jgi:hypothetical protein
MTCYSHSRLSTFEQCRYKYKLHYIDKVKVDVPTPVENKSGAKYQCPDGSIVNNLDRCDEIIEEGLNEQDSPIPRTIIPATETCRFYPIVANISDFEGVIGYGFLGTTLDSVSRASTCLNAYILMISTGIDYNLTECLMDEGLFGSIVFIMDNPRIQAFEKDINPWDEAIGYKVEVLDGDYKGATGWVWGPDVICD